MTRKRPRWFVFRIFVIWNFWSESESNLARGVCLWCASHPADTFDLSSKERDMFIIGPLKKIQNYHVRSCFPSSFSGDWNVRNIKEAFLKHLSCWQPGNCKENFFQLKSTKNIKKSTNSNAKQRRHSTCWLVVSLFEPILYFWFCYIKPTIRAFVVTL